MQLRRDLSEEAQLRGHKMKTFDSKSFTLLVYSTQCLCWLLGSTFLLNFLSICLLVDSRVPTRRNGLKSIAIVSQKGWHLVSGQQADVRLRFAARSLALFECHALRTSPKTYRVKCLSSSKHSRKTKNLSCQRKHISLSFQYHTKTENSKIFGSFT